MEALEATMVVLLVAIAAGVLVMVGVGASSDGAQEIGFHGVVDGGGKRSVRTGKERLLMVGPHKLSIEWVSV